VPRVEIVDFASCIPPTCRRERGVCGESSDQRLARPKSGQRDDTTLGKSASLASLASFGYAEYRSRLPGCWGGALPEATLVRTSDFCVSRGTKLPDFQPSDKTPGSGTPLRGQVAIVTGGGRGIGRAIAITLARAGAAVAVVSRTSGEISETAEQIRAEGGSAMATTADVQDVAAVNEAVDEVARELGPIDLLVNNAGSVTAVGPVHDVDAEAWWRDVTTNLRGPFSFSHAVLPEMTRRKNGRIVNIVSEQAGGVGAYVSAYAASKAGLVRLTNAIAEEARSSGVYAFALSPGVVETQLNFQAVLSEEAQKWRPNSKANLTFVGPEVAADSVLFIATGCADALTGRYFHVNDDIPKLSLRAHEITEHDLFSLRKRVQA
jgi:NAD(P)-dependent dehydrogenase (short-subunit alcohol dehydrogenase family)